MKNNISLTKQITGFFTVSTFNSCGIGTILQEQILHNKTSADEKKKKKNEKKKQKI